MKVAAILLVFSFSLAHASALYSDVWVEGMARMEIDDYPINDLNQPCLDIVQPGTSLAILDIFKKLNIDHTRVIFKGRLQINMVAIYTWQISDRYVLSIMTATNDRRVDTSKVPVWDLQGYGVRIFRNNPA